MSAENAEIVRRSFSVQAENFGSDAMNFTNRDYLDGMVSRLDLAGTVAALEVAAGTCACACAGGGRAGCSAKNLYGAIHLDKDSSEKLG